MDASSEETPRHLKRVSRIKHIILEKYLPAWAIILGSYHQRLAYFDCYAGPGVYECDDEIVHGSPLIALESGKQYVLRNKGKELALVFVEKDDNTRGQLQRQLDTYNPLPAGLHVFVLAEDAVDFVDRLLAQSPHLVPSFFMVDPYGHPLIIPTLNEILKRPRTEALINFMYYRINMDVANPKVQGNVDRMFGDTDWRNQAFLSLSGREREEAFLIYFCEKIDAKYKLPFRIMMDVEDHVPGNRTKYYLIHASNNAKAVLLMKEVMWKLGDEEGTFEYGGAHEFDGLVQMSLFPASPEINLRDLLLGEFHGKELNFDGIREATWHAPFIEKQYRAVILRLQHEGLVTITRVSSKLRGLREADRVRFL